MNSKYAINYELFRDDLARCLDEVSTPKARLYAIEDVFCELDEDAELSKHDRYVFLNKLQVAVADYVEALDRMTAQALDLAASASTLNDSLDGDG